MPSIDPAGEARPEAQVTLDRARRVLAIEAAAVAALVDRVDAEFVRAHDLLLHCRGRVVVSGIGKSGHIAAKIASTLASTGTPAFFLHPAEASHGDLGMVTADDVVLAISYSGESNELLALLPVLKRRGIRIVAVSGNPASTLAREADVHLDAAVDKEACPLNLAPTASTTAALALGDALALALLQTRGFSTDDFAESHPGGALGRRLLVRVSDVMHAGQAVPAVGGNVTLADALLEMSRKALGLTAIVDSDGRLTGVFTDGDLRRCLERGIDVRHARAADVMTRNPRTIHKDRLAAEAARSMQDHSVFALLVVDSGGRLVGALNMHDLLRAGVV